MTHTEDKLLSIDSGSMALALQGSINQTLNFFFFDCVFSSFGVQIVTKIFDFLMI